MRTLTTQFRLKRLIRLQGELVARLQAPDVDPRLGRAVSRRLLEAVRDVRGAWAADLAATGAELGSLRRHVSRSLSALEASVAGLERPGADRVGLSAEFHDVAGPLLFFLRGLEDTGDEALRALLAREPLSRIA